MAEQTPRGARVAAAIARWWPSSRTRRVEAIQTWMEIGGATSLVVAAFTVGATAGLLALGAVLLVAGNMSVEG